MGEPIADVEDAGPGKRIRHQHGAIYAKDHRAAVWVHGAIGARCDELGGPGSWLGFPLEDEKEFTEGGRFSEFEQGGRTLAPWN